MRTAAILPWLFWMGTGFLLGGVMFCQLLPKCLCGRDIAAESDDHNPGAVNVFLLCGPWVGALCLLLDLLKGFGPVWLAKGRLDTHSLWFAGVMAAPVLGHAAGVCHHFQGGKCIATSFGVLAALAPQCWIVLLLAGLYLFFSTVWKLRPMARRSMVTFTLFGVVGGTLLFLQGCASLATGSCLIAATAIYRHLRSPPQSPLWKMILFRTRYRKERKDPTHARRHHDRKRKILCRQTDPPLPGRGPGQGPAQAAGVGGQV